MLLDICAQCVGNIGLILRNSVFKIAKTRLLKNFFLYGDKFV